MTARAPKAVRSRIALTATVAVTVAVLLTGCATPASSPVPRANSSEPTVSPPNTNAPVAPAAEDSSDIFVRIIVGTTTLSAAVWNNSASRSFLGQLPVTLELSDYGGREMVAELPEPLSMEGMPGADAPLAGELSYYAPTGSISVTYKDLGRWEGAARLGRIVGDISVIRNHTEPVTVTFERAP